MQLIQRKDIMKENQNPLTIICRIVAAAILRLAGANVPVVEKVS